MWVTALTVRYARNTDADGMPHYLSVTFGSRGLATDYQTYAVCFRLIATCTSALLLPPWRTFGGRWTMWMTALRQWGVATAI